MTSYSAYAIILSMETLNYPYRTKQIIFRLTEEEADLLKSQAAEAGLKIEHYIRWRLRFQRKPNRRRQKIDSL